MHSSTKCIMVAAIVAGIAFVWVGGCAKKVIKVEAPFPAPVAEMDTAAPVRTSFDTAAVIDSALKAVLAPVYFDYDRSTLKPQALERLGLVGKVMADFPRVSLLLEGHCDERGTAEYNIGLGQNRSKAAKDWLLNYGIADRRIETTSLGKERPAVAGCTEEACHAQNRRVEFKVLTR